MDPTKMDWTEMSEMSSPNSGKHPSYKRTGSKDSMEVIFLIEKGNFEFCRSFNFLNLALVVLHICTVRLQLMKDKEIIKVITDAEIRTHFKMAT